MLSLLYQEGPSTKGIFRRSGSAKTFKELKEKLDSGTEVDLARESIFVTASLFKVCEECSCLPFWVRATQILCTTREGFSPETGPKRNWWTELTRMGWHINLVRISKGCFHWIRMRKRSSKLVVLTAFLRSLLQPGPVTLFISAYEKYFIWHVGRPVLYTSVYPTLQILVSL